MKAAIYVDLRASEGREDTENEIRELRRLAESELWEIVVEYIDNNSRSKTDRTQLRRMLADAAQGKFDVLIFWALDRLTGEGALKTLQYLNQLSRYGVAFRSLREPFLDSCGVFKDAIIEILAAIAKQERRRLCERVRSGLNRARLHGTRSGKHVGRPEAVFNLELVVQLRLQNKSWREIASACQVGATTVRRAYQAMKARLDG